MKSPFFTIGFKYDVGAKRYFAPMIPDRSVLHTLTILKNIHKYNISILHPTVENSYTFINGQAFIRRPGALLKKEGRVSVRGTAVTGRYLFMPAVSPPEQTAGSFSI